MRQQQRQQRRFMYMYSSLIMFVFFCVVAFLFLDFLSSTRHRRRPTSSSYVKLKIMSLFFIVLFIFLLCWIVRAGNGSRAGTVMMHVVMMSTASPWCGLRPMMAVVTVATYVVHTVGSRSRIPTTRPRVNNRVVVAVGRVRAGRIHRWTGWYVAWFGHSIQGIPKSCINSKR